ncbi:Gldg family protein [Flavitalea flava]
MKTIFRIARLELSTLFYSPVAWLVLIIFVFQSGLAFTDILHVWQLNFKMGWVNSEFTSRVFSGQRGFLPGVQNTLYLYIPLLTMGLISRELSSGSIKLLLSSPVKISAIVLGKLLAMMTYSLLLVMLLLPFVVAGHFSIASMDLGLVFSGIIGIYLLICAYSAIGLYMSSLTSYQVVAAISTLVVLAALNFIGNIWQDVPIVKDAAYWLSISGRSDQMISGLISSKGVLYFILVIVLFTGLTILKLKGARESLSNLIKAGRYALFVGLVLLLGYFTSRPLFTGYLDMTATQSRTLTVNTQKVLKQLTKPLKVTTYVNLFDNFFYNFMPKQFNQDKDRMEQYTRFLPRLKMDYVFYYDSTDNEYLYQSNPGKTTAEIAKKVGENFDINTDRYIRPEQIRKMIDLSPEENRCVRLYEYDGKRGFTRMFQDQQQFPAEAEITAVLKGFLVPHPVVAFVVGDDERDIHKGGDKGYKMVTHQLTFRYALINQGFEVDTISLQTQEIPKGLSCLVIADPKILYNEKAQTKIRDYIAAGGNVMFAGEPGRQNIVNPLIAPLGVQLMDGQLVQESKDNVPNFVLAKFSDTAGAYSPEWRNTGGILSMMGSAGLQFAKSDSFDIQPVVVTNIKDTWNKLLKTNMDSVKVTYDPVAGDLKKILPIGVGLTRSVGGRQQRIMVFGDADFMSNAEMGRGNIRTRNFELMVEMFKWFSNGTFPVDTSRPDMLDNKLTIEKEGVSLLKILFMGIIPGLILIGGAILLVRRKRK